MAATIEATAAEGIDRAEGGLDETSAALTLVLEGARPLAGGARISFDGLRAIEVGRGKALAFRRDGDRGRLELEDDRISTRHFELVWTEGAFVVTDLGSKNGTYVGDERITRATLAAGATFSAGAALFAVDHAAPSAEPLVHGARLAGLAQGIASLVPRVAAGAGRLARIAASDLSVLLLGASGTGKEVLAKAVHALSPRAAGPFVAVNCAALPANLLESQLFGHVKGAFSGAVKDEPGLFRAADGGTLFLDEIGDMPVEAQPALLRALEAREVTPVGATRPIAVDVRVVAATLREEHHLRDDLRMRLAGYTHRLVPLRERRADLGLLLRTLLPRIAGERAGAVRISAEAVRALGAYGFPLNVRELFQVTKSALVLAGDALVVRRSDLPTSVVTPSASSVAGPARPPDGQPAASADGPRRAKAPVPAEERRERLLELLRAHGGNLSEVARRMDTTRVQVHRWLEKFAIDPSTFRAKDDRE